MEKQQIGPKPLMHPLPTTLVGANVGGKPNFLTVGYCGMLCSSPPTISVALTKTHYTNIGIKENGTFSVNIPSVEMARITDYCGLVSGRKVDKSRLFHTFYGRLGTAPMIEECATNLECKLVQILEFGKNEIFIGEIVQVYCEEQYLTDGLPDIAKVNPIIYAHNDGSYWKVGERLAKAYNIGKDFQESDAL